MFTAMRAVSAVRITMSAGICMLGLGFASVVRAQDNPDPCEQFGMNATAFVGQIGVPVMHTIRPSSDVPATTFPAYPVAVEQAFRGVDAGSTVYLFSFDLSEGLVPGRRYLIYGSFNFGNLRNVVTISSRIPVEDAGRDLEFLTSRDSAVATTGRVYGVVQQGNAFDTRDRRPLSGIGLRVRVGDFLTETVSDAQGRFDVSGLPEGLFTIEPDLPPQLTTTHGGGGEVRPGGCVSTTVLAQWNGIIRGRVTRPDQSPVRGPVDLISAGGRIDSFIHEGRTETAGANGEFEFSAVPPGDYLVGVNLKRPPSPGMPYEPTYFPGTGHRADATAVHVGEGTVHDAVDLVVGASLARGRVEIHPTPSSDGALFGCVAGVGTYQQRTPGAPVIIDLVEGTHYRLRLHVEERSGRHAESDIVELTGARGDRTLTLATRPARAHPAGLECANDLLP